MPGCGTESSGRLDFLAGIDQQIKIDHARTPASLTPLAPLAGLDSLQLPPADPRATVSSAQPQRHSRNRVVRHRRKAPIDTAMTPQRAECPGISASKRRGVLDLACTVPADCCRYRCRPDTSAAPWRHESCAGFLRRRRRRTTLLLPRRLAELEAVRTLFCGLRLHVGPELAVSALPWPTSDNNSMKS